jgi:SAM-dependent methyltransferase
MSYPPPTDPEEFKAAQRAIWSTVAPGWKKWWPLIEACAQPVNERLVELARVRPGSRVLDVASGLGEPALTAARRAGEKGSVLGVDLSPEMLALARDRVIRAKLSNVEFLEMDAEKLALEPASFDAAVSRWGIMLLMDPLAALRGVRAALRSGARAAFAVWGVPETVPFLALPMQAVRRELGIAAPPPGTPGPMVLGKPGDLEALLERAGFREIEVHVMTATMRFESPEQHRAFLEDQSGSLKKAMAEHTPEARERAWSAIARETQPYAQSDGSLRYENQVRCAVGRA